MTHRSSQPIVRSSVRALVALVLVGVAALVSTGAQAAPPVPVVEYSSGITAASGINPMTKGPDGNIWFTEQQANKIGKITPDGTVTEFAIPAGGSGPKGITAGPDNALWWVEISSPGRVGRIPTNATSSADMTAFTLPVPSTSNALWGITAHPNGYLYASASSSSGTRRGVIRIDADNADDDGTGVGSMVRYIAPTDSVLRGIAVGADGNLWITNKAPDPGQIVIMAPDGSSFTSYSIPGGSPQEITSGPDVALWYGTEADAVGRVPTSVDSDDDITQYSGLSGVPSFITTGPDNQLWFTQDDGKVLRMNTSGSILQTIDVGGSTGPRGIALGGDGNMWITQIISNQVGKLVIPAGDTPQADFNADEDTDLSVYRNGYWYVKDQIETSWGGDSTDKAVPGDYDKDGDSDLAVYRAGTGAWYIKDQFETSWGGDSTDIPVPGDYDGDGDTDIAVYRASTGYWYVRNQPGLEGQWGGDSTDIPVPGDYDKDGDTDMAVYRGSTGTWYVKGQPALESQWGGAGTDMPVPGDYDKDGDTDMAVYRAGTGYWYVKDQPALEGPWGGDSSDVPVPGDYDADGDTDIAVYRVATGYWYVKDQPSLEQQWGGESVDVPLPLAASLR